MLLEAWKEKRRETMRTRVTMECRLPWSLVLHNIRFRGERASDDHDVCLWWGQGSTLQMCAYNEVQGICVYSFICYTGSITQVHLKLAADLFAQPGRPENIFID